MAQRLVIYLDQAQDEHDYFGYAILGDTGELIDQGEAPLSQIAKLQGARRVIAIIDGSAVCLAKVQVPSSNINKIRQALPAILEEQLSEDIDKLHFAIGARTGDNCEVMVIDKAKLAAYNSMLQDAQIFVSQMLPSTLALPYTENNWTALIGAREAQVRYNDYAAFTAPLAELGAYLQLAVSETGQNDASLTVFAPENSAASDWQQLNFNDMRLFERRANREVAALAQGLPANLTTCNLLQGEFAPKRRQNALAKNWFGTLLLLMAFALIYLISTAISAYKLNSETNELYQQISTHYRQAFPGSRMVDVSLIKRQIDSKLAALGAGSDSDALAILHKTLQVVATSSAKLLSFEYRQNSLQLELQSADMAALDALKQNLSKAGLKAQISGANNRDGKVIGRIKVD